MMSIITDIFIPESVHQCALWGIKNTPNFFHHNMKKSDPILISFGTSIPDITGHQLIFHLTHCLLLHYPGKENKHNIAFLTTGIIA